MFTFFLAVLVIGIAVQKLASYAKQNPSEALHWANNVRKLFGK
ncbi:hypothetical protein [Humisphaera borealis]|nr:hypothetical protein [Humisphaera borealis]